MRMGAFLLGGIVGAAAVMYWNNNGYSKSMMFSSAGKAMNNARNGLMNSSSNNMNRTSTDHGMNAVQNIIEKDPHLKQEVEGIIAHGQETTTH